MHAIIGCTKGVAMEDVSIDENGVERFCPFYLNCICVLDKMK